MSGLFFLAGGLLGLSGSLGLLAWLVLCFPGHAASAGRPLLCTERETLCLSAATFKDVAHASRLTASHGQELGGPSGPLRKYATYTKSNQTLESLYIGWAPPRSLLHDATHSTLISDHFIVDFTTSLNSRKAL